MKTIIVFSTRLCSSSSKRIITIIHTAILFFLFIPGLKAQTINIEPSKTKDYVQVISSAYVSVPEMQINKVTANYDSNKVIQVKKPWRKNLTGYYHIGIGYNLINLNIGIGAFFKLYNSFLIGLRYDSYSNYIPIGLMIGISKGDVQAFIPSIRYIVLNRTFILFSIGAGVGYGWGTKYTGTNMFEGYTIKNYSSPAFLIDLDLGIKLFWGLGLTFTITSLTDKRAVNLSYLIGMFYFTSEK